MTGRPVTQQFNFQSPQADQLSGRLDLPRVGAPVAFAVFAHCFSCSKDLAASRGVSSALTAQGIGVLRFDFTGLGNSQGDFANSHFRANVEDLGAAIAAMASAGMTPSLLVGHSLGGAAVLQAAAMDAGIKAVATIGAPYDPAHVANRLEGDLEAIRIDGEGAVTIAGRTFQISKRFLDELRPEALDARLSRLRAALLVCHSPIDATVGIENATNIFATARHPKSFLSLDQADHLLTRPQDAAFVGQQIATWAKRYIPLIAAEAPRAEDEVLVLSSGLGKFQQNVLVNGHALVADEPKSVGGLDTGPAPYDLLLAALGACTNMTLSLYAARKGLAIERVETRLSHAKIYAKDCADCETSGGRIDEIKRTIQIVAPTLSEAEHTRLLEIADMCPVHRTLHTEVKIRTARQS